jgi:hypothetical protein
MGYGLYVWWATHLQELKEITANVVQKQSSGWTVNGLWLWIGLCLVPCVFKAAAKESQKNANILDKDSEMAV